MSESGGKVMFALLGIVALCSLVAIIISAITLSRPSQVPTINLSGLGGGGGAPPVVMGGGGSCSGGSDSGKTFKIAVGHDYGAHDYMDDKGYLQGYTKEIVTEVCEAAGIRCVVIWDKYSNCWESKAGEHSLGGKGLMGGWYDGCAGWWQTVGRTMVYDFTQPYLKAPKDYFFVREGESLDPKQIKDNQKIGFLNGWAQDEKCLARSNITLKASQVVYVEVVDQLVKMLKDGKIDALFSADFSQKYMDDNKLARVTPSLQCALGGSSVMIQKDNALVGHWNRGFSTIRSNGRYHRHCDEAWTRHGHREGKIGGFPCFE